MMTYTLTRRKKVALNHLKSCKMFRNNFLKIPIKADSDKKTAVFDIENVAFGLDIDISKPQIPKKFLSRAVARATVNVLGPLFDQISRMAPCDVIRKIADTLIKQYDMMLAEQLAKPDSALSKMIKAAK